MSSKIKNICLIIMISLIFLWGIMAGIERLVFLHAEHYPDFLVKETVTLDSKDKLYQLIDLICPQGGTDIVKRKDALYLRCGYFLPKSYVTKVFIVEHSSANGAEKNKEYGT